MHWHAARVSKSQMKVQMVITTLGRHAEAPLQLLQDAAAANTKAGGKPAAADEQKASSSKVRNTQMHAEKDE